MVYGSPHWTFDRSPASTVALCRHCDQRFIAARFPGAAAALAVHLRAAHPERLTQATLDYLVRRATR